MTMTKNDETAKQLEAQVEEARLSILQDSVDAATEVVLLHMAAAEKILKERMHPQTATNVIGLTQVLVTVWEKPKV